MSKPKAIKLKVNAEAVKVVVRCRPLSKNEEADKNQSTVCVHCDQTRGAIAVRKGGVEDKSFTFDAVYAPGCSQINIYDETARPIVASALEGYNGTIFAYGQTGTGKTYTMEGVYAKKEERGIIPNAFQHIFTHIDDSKNKQYLVRASYLEIYNEEIRDLLSKDYAEKKLPIKEHPERGVYVKDLSTFVVKSFEEIDQLMAAGKKNRHVATTRMNQESSRSHSVFTITIECSELGPDGAAHIRVGRLNLVDLAGSERQKKTGAEDATLVEAVNINLSLATLGNVISALAEGRDRHIPYRDSKLTRLLQDSLGGNSRTAMIANIGPAQYNYDETITTLRYANRAKNIKNKPTINEDPKDAMLRQYQEEIERLRREIAQLGPGGAPATVRGADGQIMHAGDDGYNDAAMREAEQRIAAERQRLLEDKSKTEEEKAQIEKALEERQSAINAERERHTKLAERLQQMEARVLIGGVNYIELSERQERQIETDRAEVERAERERRRLEEELAEQQADMLSDQEKFSNLKEEAEVKTQKLKRLWNKLQTAKVEIRDIQDEHMREKGNLVDQIRWQNNELKLCKIIIYHFIPPTEVDKIRKRAVWKEELEDYELMHEEFTGNNIYRLTEPLTAADHARFQTDNINQLETSAIAEAPEDGDENDENPVIPNVYLSYSPDRDLRPRTAKGDVRPKSRPTGKQQGLLKPPSKMPVRGSVAPPRKAAAPPVDESQYPKSRGHVVGGR